MIGRLIKELGAQVVMMGAPPPYRDFESPRGDGARQGAERLARWSDPCRLARAWTKQTWPIRRILTFAAQCDLVIGPDTGPSWGVAFEPMPKIIMVSHTSAENITKHWRNTVTLHADPQRFRAGRVIACTTRSTPAIRSKNTVGNEFASCIADVSVEAIVTTAARLLRGEHHG